MHIITYDGNIPPIKLGPRTTKRIAHILPRNQWLARAFRWLRNLFGDSGDVANWTRNWECEWMVHIVHGPTFGPFATRSEAIHAEHRYLDVVLKLNGELGWQHDHEK